MKDRAYIAITNKEILESHINDPYNWGILMRNFEVPVARLLCYLVKIDEYVYMIFEDYFIFKLNMKQK